MDLQELINLVLTLVVVVVWILQRVLRSRARKQQPTAVAQEQRQTAPAPARTPVAPFRPGPAVPTRSRGAEYPGWKALMDRIVELEDQARRLRDRASSLPSGDRLTGWIDRYVLEISRRLEREMGTTGSMDSARIGGGTEALVTLEARLDALRTVAAQRAEAGDEMAKAELLAQGLLAGLKVDRRKSVADETLLQVVTVAEATDAATVNTLEETGLLALYIAPGWSRRVDIWPETVHLWVLRKLGRMRGFRAEVFQRFGLAPQWPVPYSEPVYVTASDVLGPFGAWLDVLLADVVTCLLVGPWWADVLLGQVRARSTRDGVLKAPVSRSGYYLGNAPPAALRARLLAHIVARAGADETARSTLARWNEAVGAIEGMWMPTRRGTFYGVPLEPYQEAGESLLDVLMQESFDALGGQRLVELEAANPAEISPQTVQSWVSIARAGQGVRASSRVRIATVLSACLTDPDSTGRIAAAALDGLIVRAAEPRVWAGPVPAGRGLLDLSPAAVGEAMVLQAVLGPAGRRTGPSFGISSRSRWARGLVFPD